MLQRELLLKLMKEMKIYWREMKTSSRGMMLWLRKLKSLVKLSLNFRKLFKGVLFHTSCTIISNRYINQVLLCNIITNLDQIILTYPYINRLEGKAANLEAENQVLRQQATSTPPSTAKSPASRSKIARIHVNVSLKNHLLIYLPSHSFNTQNCNCCCFYREVQRMDIFWMVT